MRKSITRKFRSSRKGNLISDKFKEFFTLIFYYFRLDDTIDLLKKSEPTQSVEPVIRSRIPIVTRVQESPAVDKIDKMENEKWKLRYNQLEEKYLDGQKLVNSTIENMEKAYNAKLKTIENSVNMIKSHKVNKPPEPTFKPVSRLNPPPLAGITLRNPVRSQSAHSVSSEMIDPPRVAKRNLLNQTRPALKNSSSSETSSESESEEKSDDDSRSLIKQVEVHRADLIQKASVNSFKKDKSIKLDESLQKLENISPPAEPIPPQAAPREVFSAQKVNIKEKPKKRTKTLPIEDVDYKDAALTAFEERIKAMGLDERHKVKQKDFAAINEEIVKNREGIKKVC